MRRTFESNHFCISWAGTSTPSLWRPRPMAKYWSRAERPVEAYLAGMTCRAAGVSRWPLAQRFFGGTHVEGVGEVEDVVVQSEVTAAERGTW